MKRMKKLAGSIAIGLLLGASLAQAQEEVCYDGSTVIGVKNLTVTTNEFSSVTMNVDFRYQTGFDIYGPELDNLPFGSANAEEDAGATNLAINNALDEEIPVPVDVGQPGQNAYFIGAEKEIEAGLGAIAAYGSENLTDGFWDQCTQANDCLLGVAVLAADQRFVYADLARADGSSCDSTAPPPLFTITPGITGSWFDRARDGEGFNIEIVGSTLDPQFLAYFYTYDDSENQMWLTGVAPASGGTAIVPMTVTSGTVFGPGFDPDDVVRDDWGTITFTFSSCNAGTAEYTSTNFGSGTFNIERLTSVSGVACP